jgi:hypothetical protein
MKLNRKKRIAWFMFKPCSADFDFMGKNNRKPDPPKVMSIQEASGFWNEHSLLEFDGTKEVDVTFQLKRKNCIGLDREVFKKLNAQARRHRVTPEALVESWIIKNLRRYASKS